MISKRLVFTALGAAVLGVGMLATAGTASADGGYDNNDHHWYHDDKDDDKHDWDWYDKHDKCDDDDYHGHGHGDWYGSYWNADWDEDWDGHGYPDWENKKKKDWDDKHKWGKDDCDDDHHKVKVIYIYSTHQAFYYPFTAPEFGRYNDGVQGLIQDAAIVMGVTEQWLYDELAKGRTLSDIGIDRLYGPIALADAIVAMNPDIAPYIHTVISTPWLLTAQIYIPV